MKDSMIRFGPCVVPTVPYKHFSRVPAEVSGHDVWKIIGPTVQRNINAPLWKQFCAVYYEGLEHGSQIVALKEQP